ncbi:MAG: helix-turn-helix domain-containing protein [Candidatus Competibacteraceae bacterium]
MCCITSCAINWTTGTPNCYPTCRRWGPAGAWARRRAALKQANLARLLGKKQQYISSLEHDRIESPTRAVLAALAARLAVSPAWLMYGAAAVLIAAERALLEDYRHLGDRDRALVRCLVQTLRHLPP